MLVITYTERHRLCLRVHYCDAIMSELSSHIAGVSFRHRSKKTSKLYVTGHCEGNSPMTGEFPAQRANNAETVSIRWRHHGLCLTVDLPACQQHYARSDGRIFMTFSGLIGLATTTNLGHLMDNRFNPLEIKPFSYFFAWGFHGC